MRSTRFQKAFAVGSVLLCTPVVAVAQDESHASDSQAAASPPALSARSTPAHLGSTKLRAPRPPSPGWGLQSLRLAPQQLAPTLLPQGESAGLGQGPPQGFINLNIPKELSAEAILTEAGLFAGKLWLMKSLCGLGRCRVDTGPGDLQMSWVEQFTDYGVSAPASGPAPGANLPSAR
jgi:hypothetical protein